MLMTEVEETLPIPWTLEYLARRNAHLKDALNDRELVARFRDGQPLPERYGRGLDERCIEYPWLLSRLPGGPARLLDAGSTLNHEWVLDHPSFATLRIHILTLAPEKACYWHRGISYAYDDMRSLPFKDGLFDIVAAVSSIEHVGCDNSFYTGVHAAGEPRLDDFSLAMRELARVLRPGGLLLFTVPYGQHQFHGAFQQFDRRCLTRAETASDRLSLIDESFYRYTIEGWRIARDQDCRACEYVAWVSDLMRTRQWPATPLVDTDHAAAARAVACVQMMKLETPQ
jgi:SAM-dependent methyltransferase